VAPLTDAHAEPPGRPNEGPTSRYATFITFRGGLIANYREYWNPMVFLEALSGESF